VVIDPYRTRTAACADWYLPINPGTDGALALGMMHVIISEGLHDADYVARYTVGFDDLRERVQEYPPERVEKWTGIPAADIVRLAREYATIRPAVIRLNYGVQRSEGGGMATRAIAMLPCITGSWKRGRGGLQLSTSGAYGLNKEALERTDLMLTKAGLGRPARTINMVELGQALNTLQDPPVKALFVYNSNPRRCVPITTTLFAGCCVLTCSPSCTNSSLPTPSTTLTLCFLRPRSSSTRICRQRTAITICKCRTRPLRRWVSAGRMLNYFAGWRSAWDLTMTALENPWIR